MKQLHYGINIDKNMRNPKKTWALLKEISMSVRAPQNIDKLIIQDREITNNSEIANEFNEFSQKLDNLYLNQ